MTMSGTRINLVRSVRSIPWALSRRWTATNTSHSCNFISLTLSSSPSSLGMISWTSNRRLFHRSIIVEKPKKSNGKSDQPVVKVELPDTKAFTAQIDRTLNWLTSEFAKVKVGHISPEFFANLSVGSYGALSHLAQISMKTSSKLVISVYDPNLVKAVVDAVKDCGLNLNPVVESSSVLANIPRPTKEARELMIKQLAKIAEKSKQDIRHFRKDCLDGAKKCKGSASEDEIKRHAKEVRPHRQLS